MTEREINQKAAEAMCIGRGSGEHQFEFSDFVGLLDGKLIVVSDDPEVVFETLRAIDPDPTRGFVFNVGQLADDIAYRRLLYVRSLSMMYP